MSRVLDVSPEMTKTAKRRQDYFKSRVEEYDKLGPLKVPEFQAELQDYRRKLNMMSVFPVSTHPKFSELWKWTLNNDNIKFVKNSNRREIIFVEEKVEFDLMYHNLKCCSEIAFDTEHDNRTFYNDMICLIQIASHTNIYVIDVFKTFKYFKPKLEEIFLSSDIVKICFGSEEAFHIQRDFNFRIFPLIDIQSVYKVYKKVDNLSFETLTKELLNVNLDKSLQTYSYARRPLNNAMKKYAADDAKFTLDCWNTLKVIMSNILIEQAETLLFTSKTSAVRQYKFPKKREYNFMYFYEWLDLNTFSDEIRNIFVQERDLFEIIWYKAKEIAKMLDVRQKRLLSLNEIGLIFTRLPTTKDYFVKIVPKVRFWDEDTLNIILNTVKQHVTSRNIVKEPIVNDNHDWDKNIVNEMVSRVPEGSHDENCNDVNEIKGNNVIDFSMLGDSPKFDFVDDNEPMNIEIESVDEPIENLEISVKNKTLKNFVLSKQRKLNRQRVNYRLDSIGLPIILSKRSKGKKWRQKGLFRKYKGLKVGVTTLKSPLRGFFGGR